MVNAFLLLMYHRTVIANTAESNWIILQDNGPNSLVPEYSDEKSKP